MRTSPSILALTWALFLTVGGSIISKPSSATSPLVTAGGSSQDAPERRGCCSHHGGVCGCDGGRVRCCDGALSPSCGCYGGDPSVC